MSSEDQTAAPDAPGETEPNVEAKEQTTDYADTLLALAREDGHAVGLEEPPTTEPEEEQPEPEAPGEPDEESESEEEQPEAAKDTGDKLVPLRELMEERAKKKRANERADIAHAEVEQLRAALQQNLAPKPTEDDPFRDVLDLNNLDRLESSYERAIELADEFPPEKYPDGVEGVIIGRNPDGSARRQDFSAEKLVEVKRKAEKAIRKSIPERRTYLQQRAIADQQAAEIYPELKDGNSDFTKAVAVLANSLMTGQAMKAPDILVWIGHAVRGYQMKLQENGQAQSKVKTPEAKKIVKGAQTQIAPTPTRSRSFVERGTRSVSMDKAAKKLEQRGDADSAEEYVAALFSQRGGSKRLEPLGG